MGTLEADKLKTLRIEEIISAYPFARMFFDNNGIDPDRECGRTLEDYFNALSEIEKEEMAVDPEHFIRQLTDYHRADAFISGGGRQIGEISHHPSGTLQNRRTGTFKNLTISRNEIISIVGPTGSGKSRLWEI